MKIYICPVCGYDGLDEKPYGENLNPSHNICSCCGFEYGYSEDHDVDLGYIVIPHEMKEAAFQLYRKQWIENGAPVHTPTEIPEEHQLNKAVFSKFVAFENALLNIPVENETYHSLRTFHYYGYYCSINGKGLYNKNLQYYF